VLSELVLDTQSPAQNLWCHSVKDERGGQRPGECLRVRRNERRQAATLQETVPTIPREEVGAPRRGRSDPACKAGIVLKLPLGRLAVGLEVGRVDVVEVPRASADGPFTTFRSAKFLPSGTTSLRNELRLAQSHSPRARGRKMVSSMYLRISIPPRSVCFPRTYVRLFRNW